MTPTEPIVVFPNVVTIAFGALTWLVGVGVVKKVSFLSRYNIPASIVGGLLVAVLFEILHENGVPLPEFDTELINSLMVAFFASLGFGASIRVLRKGGRDVIKYLALCSLLLFIQALVGVGVAYLLGQHLLFGVLSSVVSLAGGPGTALAFAPSFEQAGVQNASTIGLATAMGGLLLGGILGGPVATLLIRRKRLVDEDAGRKIEEKADDKSDWLSPDEFAKQLLLQNAYLLVVGSVGWYLSKGFGEMGIKLPFYIGAMIIAAIVRNIDDATGIFKFNIKMIEAIGSTCLTLFVATMMMTLQLWTVSAVAGALIIMLIVQMVFVCLTAATVMYYFSGKDYDAAVMSGGYVGFMLGTTATAMASMNSLAEKYGPAPRAFLVVPIVGACFIDFVNAIVISVCLNIFS